MISEEGAAFAAFEKRFGYTFDNRAHLELAVSHRSWCAENDAADSNERLEFLGDSVLGLAVTTYLFRVFGSLEEGRLAKLRASVVSEVALSAVAAQLGVGEVVRLGRGEKASGGSSKPSILSDAMEALIAAVYLDAGWDAANAIVVSHFSELIERNAKGPSDDYKNLLQEHVARAKLEALRYEAVSEGLQHAPTYSVSAYIGAQKLGEGVAATKKQAEQIAAEQAYKSLTSK